MRLQDAIREFQADLPRMHELGIFPDEGARCYIPDGFKSNFALAMDAQPQLSTDPNSGVPSMLTTFIDPEVYKILFAPNRAAEIYGEKRKGDWLMDTTMFPVVEHTGEVSSYGDYAENGSAGANTNWPQRQNYVFQTIKQYGERESARAGLARINWISEIDMAAVTVLNKFSNYSYFFGIAGLQNYGWLTDPNLSAPLTPATKSAGGTKWIVNNVVVATANEIYLDIESTVINLINQSAGLVNRETKMALVLSPSREGALTATNSFAVNVSDLLKKNFPNMTVISAVQLGALSASNPQGVAAGDLLQVVADNIEGQDTGFCGFSEKLRSHAIVKMLSSFKQKVTAATWGGVVRQPFGVSQMLGI